MNLDRNQIIGIVLLALSFGAYIYLAPKEEAQIPKIEQKIAEKSGKTDLIKDTTVLDSTLQSAPEKWITIENADFTARISSKGAKLVDVKLVNYLNYDKKSNVVLLQDSMTTRKTMIAGEDISNESYSYQFSTNESNIKVSGEDKEIVLTTTLKNGKQVTQKYIVPAQGFVIKHKIEGEGLKDQSELAFEFSNELPFTERKFKEVKAYDFARQHASLNYYSSEEKTMEDLGSGMGNDSEEAEGKINWFSFRQRFFVLGVAPEQNITKAKFNTECSTTDADTLFEKKMIANYSVPLSSDKTFTSSMYVGPNDFYVLEKTGIQGFGDNVDMGWLIFGVINRWVILPVFDFLADSFGDFGLVIFLLVLFIKIILFPIAYKSYQSMAKMKALKPDLDKLKEKHKDDQQQFATAQMGLYRQAGVNPLAGCLPQLLQIPFLFALFRFFPNAIQLRQESFLWAEDLSAYDALIQWDTWIWGVGTHISVFTILMTAATLLNTWYNSQFSTMSAGSDNPMQQQMKYLMYIMPLIFFFVLNDFPSGLTYYYLISTLFTMGQQFVSNKMIDPEALRAKIDVNIKNAASGNVKKSRFQQRLEEAMEAQKNQKKK